MPKIAPVVRMCAPEHWGQVTIFGKFYGGTYEFNERDQRAVIGLSAHFDKSMRLQSLAGKLKPNLALDWQELEERGFTPADYGAELATVIEAAFLELYSAIDCAVKVLRAIYAKDTRGLKDSTRGLFQDPDKLTGSFPERLKDLIREAVWFKRLVNLRDELTHLSTGDVHWDEKTDLVRYTHRGLKERDQILEFPDVFSTMNELTTGVNQFLGAVFQHLNTTLSNKPVFHMCAMVEGRLLHRYINPAEQITFDSGRCGSWVWFELPGNPTCPFKEFCGAYANKATSQDVESNFSTSGGA